MKKYVILVCLNLITALSTVGADRFISFCATDSAIPLSTPGAEIIYDDNDWEGVKIAIGNLKEDLKAVTGDDKANIVIGTAGKSRCVSQYKDLAKKLKGKWEQYIITVDGDRLVIMGSDKRGTIYGIYELSHQANIH